MLTQWVTFLQFCVDFSLVALPVSVDTLVWYAQHLSSKLKAHSTLRCYLSGVKKLHQVLGLPTESFNSYILQMTLMGLCRDNQHVVKQALAMTPEWLEKMIPFLDFNTEMDTLFWTACLVAFFFLFRKSNLLPESQLTFNTLQQLKRNDLIFTGQHLIVGIRWAKTHQFSRELLTFPLPLIRGHRLCPVAAINRVFKQIKRGSRDHLFSFSNGTSLTYPAFQSKLRGVLVAAGHPTPMEFSSHSFRRGGCSFGFLCGVPVPLLKSLGNWRSDNFMRYLEFPLETRLAASEMMKIRLLHQNFKY